MEQLWRDFRYSLRQFAKNPGLAALAVLAFALGIGSTTTMFSIYHGIVTGAQSPFGFRQLRASGLENSTLGTWLHDAGYRTIFIGKYANGYPDRDPSYIPPGWDEWYVTFGGYKDHYYNFRVIENGTVVHYECCEAYETDLQRDWAVDFIRRTAADSLPFLVYLAPFAPHVESIPAARHQGEFADAMLPRVASLNEEDVSDKPSFIANLPQFDDDQIDRWDELYRQRLRSMLAVGEMIDSIVDALEETGQRENTYILFTSDNGWHNGEHRLPRNKTTAYYEDIHVPLFVVGPGVPKGIERDDILLNTDLAPTVADLAGVIPPGFVDGSSFAPLLSRICCLIPDRRERDHLLVEWSRINPSLPQREEFYWDHAYRAVRTLDYLYVEWDNGELELYDKRVDPFELENIAYTANPKLLSTLSSWIAQLASCAGAGCRTAEGF